MTMPVQDAILEVEARDSGIYLTVRDQALNLVPKLAQAEASVTSITQERVFEAGRQLKDTVGTQLRNTPGFARQFRAALSVGYSFKEAVQIAGSGALQNASNGIRSALGNTSIGNFVYQYRMAIGAGLSTSTALDFAYLGAFKAVGANVATAGATTASAGAGLTAAAYGAAFGAGLLVGYSLVKTGAGRYLGLEAAGEGLGNLASNVFGSADTNGTAFKFLDGALNCLGLA